VFAISCSTTELADFICDQPQDFGTGFEYAIVLNEHALKASSARARWAERSKLESIGNGVSASNKETAALRADMKAVRADMLAREARSDAREKRMDEERRSDKEDSNRRWDIAQHNTSILFRVITQDNHVRQQITNHQTIANDKRRMIDTFQSKLEDAEETLWKHEEDETPEGAKIRARATTLADKWTNKIQEC
jgi:hypothetical protein